MKPKQLHWQSSIWKTEAEALSWLRGQLRRIWANWPLKNDFKKSKLEPVQPHHNISSKRVKNVGQCQKCLNYFAASNMEVDHKQQAGALGKTPESVGLWLFDLLCSADNLQLLCKPCHKIKSYADRVGCTFDEASNKKKVIAFRLLTQQKQVDTLLSLGLSKTEIAKTKVGREGQYESICNVGGEQ